MRNVTRVSLKKGGTGYIILQFFLQCFPVKFNGLQELQMLLQI